MEILFLRRSDFVVRELRVRVAICAEHASRLTKTEFIDPPVKTLAAVIAGDRQPHPLMVGRFPYDTPESEMAR